MANIINGKVYPDGNVSITNNTVYINGKRMDGLDNEKIIIIEITGNVDTLNVDACSKIVVNGTVGNVKTLSGDVDCQDISGSVQTMSGDVDANNIGGSVSTMSGDVKYKKN